MHLHLQATPGIKNKISGRRLSPDFPINGSGSWRKSSSRRRCTWQSSLLIWSIFMPSRTGLPCRRYFFYLAVHCLDLTGAAFARHLESVFAARSSGIFPGSGRSIARARVSVSNFAHDTRHMLAAIEVDQHRGQWLFAGPFPHRPVVQLAILKVPLDFIEGQGRGRFHRPMQGCIVHDGR